MKILDKSLETAYKLHNGIQPYSVYAFIFSGNKMISIGMNNMLKEDAKAYQFGLRFNVDKMKRYPFKHAEVDAISKLWGRHHISGKDKLVVVRLTKSGELGLAKPCPSCQTIISSLGIDKVWWTTNSGFVNI